MSGNPVALAMQTGTEILNILLTSVLKQKNRAPIGNPKGRAILVEGFSITHVAPLKMHIMNRRTAWVWSAHDGLVL